MYMYNYVYKDLCVHLYVIVCIYIYIPGGPSVVEISTPPGFRSTIWKFVKKYVVRITFCEIDKFL